MWRSTQPPRQLKRSLKKMAWRTRGICNICHGKVGPLIDHGASVYFCRSCFDYHAIEYIPRRFDLPRCVACGERYLKDDLVRDYSTPCPHCRHGLITWEPTSHLSIRYEPETPPKIGELVQGHIRNTGYIQRIDFVNSNMRGRLAADEDPFDDGTPVEAEVLSLGNRSVDVRIVRELSDVPRQTRSEQDADQLPARDDSKSQ
jgi:hypothetical protein